MSKDVCIWCYKEYEVRPSKCDRCGCTQFRHFKDIEDRLPKEVEDAIFKEMW